MPAFLNRIRLQDEPRLAVFNAEGTLWSVDIADELVLWMIGTGRIRVTSSRWAEYRQVSLSNPTTAARYRLTFFAGLKGVELKRHIHTFWSKHLRFEWFDEPVAVLRHLASLKFNIWLVTSGPAEPMLPIRDYLPVSCVVGNDFAVDQNGVLTGGHVGINCVGLGKARKVRTLWDGPIQFVAASSLHDEALLRLARDVSWAVYPHPALAAIARASRWEILPFPGSRQAVPNNVWLSLEEELEVRGFTGNEG